MKTHTVTKREGEWLGPIEWGYDFDSHFEGLCLIGASRDEYIQDKISNLQTLEEKPGEYFATSDGGWPRCGWRKVLEVGMYDGWPYWKPVPSVCLGGAYGAEWHSFSSITSIMKRNDHLT